MGPHLTQCRQTVTKVEAYLHTKWYPDATSRLATVDMGRKLGGLSPLFGGNWVLI